MAITKRATAHIHLENVMVCEIKCDIAISRGLVLRGEWGLKITVFRNYNLPEVDACGHPIIGFIVLARIYCMQDSIAIILLDSCHTI